MGTLGLGLGVLAIAMPATAQDSSPAYELLCSDCSGTEYFGDLDPGDTADCQNYQHNVFENWTAEGTSSPDPKSLAAAQTDIVEVNETSDATFWYYQVVTRASSWSSVLAQSLNLELAFGDCSDPATRFVLLASYTTTAADVGSTWRPQGNAQVKVYRDDSAGNDRVGDVANDGPAAPVGNTSNFDSNDNGYDTDVVVAASDVYTRLATASGSATMEIAIRRTSVPLLAVANPFTPCFGRAWTGQTSTISKDQFAINDQRPTADFTSTSWALDNCAVAAPTDPCDPAPDCTGFDTGCGVASCDPGGLAGNCDLLTPRTAGAVCRASTGDCDPAETCDGTSTGACPADAFAPVDTPCGSPDDSICDHPDSCDAGGTCLPNYEDAATVCRPDAGECDVEETCDGAGACPADAFEPGGTSCGSSDDSVCDNADSCDGSGTCLPNHESAATVCRPDAGECDVEETCDGAGACPADAFEPGGTSCGSADDSVCDNPDSCDGSGTCLTNHESAATVCRADLGECDVEETCDGAGACPADAFEPGGTSCGSADDSVCDNPDSCDGSGTCLTNHESAATVCRADAGLCDVEETCDGAGACPADAFEPGGTSCGSPADSACDNPDSCDGGGNCLVNNEPASTVCRTAVGDCDVEETCDGAGACPSDVFEPAATACGSADDSICDDPDSCDGSGTCLPNHASAATVCRADAGECDVEESCDGAGACPADAYEPGGTACGDSTDSVCDAPDSCDGGGNCLVNNEAGTTVCRTAVGDCDVEETCDGAGACPSDTFVAVATPCGSPDDSICDDPDSCDGNGSCLSNHEPSTTVCRAQDGACDVEELCDGSGDCPADAFAAPDTACRAPAGPCDATETCDGTGGECPADVIATAGTECRSLAGGCDVAETCNGVTIDCPADSVQAAAAECRPAAGICDLPETCDGASTECPADAFEPASLECRASDGVCDVAESCTGSSAACPADGFLTAATVCRSSVAACDATETCTGSDSECPTDAAMPDGSGCDDGDACTTEDSCSGGSCEPGEPLDCDDVDLCTIDSCNTQTGCVYEPWVREEDSCYHGAAGRLVVADRNLARKDVIRWTWRKGEPTEFESMGSPGSTTGYSLCIFDQASGEPRIATSLAIPPTAPYWKPPKASRLRYVDRPGTFDGVRRMRLQARPEPLKSKVLVRAKGEQLPLPEAADPSFLFESDPTLVVQFVNDMGTCWSNEFTPGEARKNTATKYRATFR